MCIWLVDMLFITDSHYQMSVFMRFCTFSQTCVYFVMQCCPTDSICRIRRMPFSSGTDAYFNRSTTYPAPGELHHTAVGDGVCVPMNPIAMLAGAWAPDRVTQASQISRGGARLPWSNLFPFSSVLWFPPLFSVFSCPFLLASSCFPWHTTVWL